MARMIPSLGPQATESRGELLLYKLFQAELSDEFTVIHSLPWLAAAIKKIDPKLAPTGEIDYLVIHPDLGVLALEVKSGPYYVKEGLFVHLTNRYSIQPVQQIRRNTHGLASWLGNGASIRLKMGYGVIFPDSHFGDQIVSAALTDISVDPPESIMIDKPQIPHVGVRVVEMMAYWKSTLKNRSLGDALVEQLVSTLCPEFDGAPTWGSRVYYDGQIWLRLTDQQSRYAAEAVRRARMVITGWPGTGKTLVGIEVSRLFHKQGKRVLVLTRNTRLAEHLERELATSGDVFTWHKLCGLAGKRLNRYSESETWYDVECVEDLNEAIGAGLLKAYDALVVDEAQAFQESWISSLGDWFKGKPIIALCDETQVFPFEKNTITIQRLSEVLGAEMPPSPFWLTKVMRMPKAVTDRLMAVKPVSYALDTPRADEPDTIREVAVHNMAGHSLEIIDELSQKYGVKTSDIVILAQYELADEYAACLIDRGVGYESVARFRGLEAPVVIILHADRMDDAELFSAYSRATTLCIALYEAEALGWGKFKGELPRKVLQLEENKATIEQAKSESLVGVIVRKYLDIQELPITSVRLAWCSSWSAWLVEFENNKGPESMWRDFLVSHYEWPVYSWDKSSRHKFICKRPMPSLIEDTGTVWDLEARYCAKCEEVTPHSYTMNLTWECIFCGGREVKRDAEITSQIIERLKLLDDALEGRRSLAAESSTNEPERLPVTLAAFGAQRHMMARHTKNIATTVDFGLKVDARSIYRTATSLLLSQVLHEPSDKVIVLSEVSQKLYDRYSDIREVLTPSKWRSEVALGVTVWCDRGLLKRLGPGKCQLNEEEDEEADDE